MSPRHPAPAPRRIAIFTDEIGWHVHRVQAALQRRGAQALVIDLADCDIDTGRASHGLAGPGLDEGLPDAALVRGLAGGSFEQVTKRLGVLHALRALGVPIVNDPRAIERSVDKAMTSVLLHQAGLATPPCWTTESPRRAQAVVERETAAGHDLVVKPLFGSQGKGLHRIRADGERRLPVLDDRHGGLFCLQRFVPCAAGRAHDWRVLVIEGEVRAAMRRYGEHWIHNIAQGARGEAATPDADMARLAVRATEVLSLSYAGVDLIVGPEGPTVLEVNGVAAWRGLEAACGLDVAQALVDALLARIPALQDPSPRPAPATAPCP